MLKNYPQRLIDDLYEEGDRDYHFLIEFLGFVGNLYPEPFMKKRVGLNKGKNQLLEDALLLASFFIGSNAYVGFYMKEYGKVDKTFDNPKEFADFIKEAAADDEDYFERITGEDRYTVGLKKIQPGAKAPLITPEIARVFSVR